MNTLFNRVIELSDSQPDKIAVVLKTESLTYVQLRDKMYGVANALIGEGIQRGDRVCYSAVSKPEMIVLYLAIQMIGAVSVFLDKNSTVENMFTIYNSADAKLMLTDKPMKDYANKCRIVSIKEIYSNANQVSDDSAFLYQMPNDDDLSEILFTTGTTGSPKGVRLSYKSVYNILSNTIEGTNISKEDIMLLPLPLNHSFALRVLRACLYVGATLVLQNGFTFAKAVEENIYAFGCTAMACVPASYEVIKSQMQGEAPSILGKLRYIEFGAGSLSVSQRLDIAELLPNVQIYNTWGSSETGGAIFCNVTECVQKYSQDRDNTVIESLGRPLDGKVEVSIINQDAPFDELANGKGLLEDYIIVSSKENPGRMAIKGNMKMQGYWNDDEQTARTLIGEWLITSDMAYMDKFGNVYMLGRADDIINVGGDKVSPIEVENIAGQYVGIKECVCVGVDDPDGITGQIPILYLVANSSYEESELIKFISARAERYKMPKEYIRISDIPRNRMQKVDRKKLKEIWIKNNDTKTIEIMNEVVNAILTRRSIRKFTDKEIPKELLEIILKCGYHAPSGKNMQTWRFTVLTKEEDILRLKSIVQETAKQNSVNFFGWENPKVLILISNDTRNTNGCQDASCAAENIMLAAHSYGIGSVWLNSMSTLRNVSPVKEILDEFGIPATHNVWSSIALGYPSSDGVPVKRKEDVVNYI